jgi:mono/diheme cytochrome c family protein
MKKIHGTLFLAAVFLGALLASAQQQKSAVYKNAGDPQLYAELAKAPEKARAKPNPLAKDSEAIKAGQHLFEQHCSECHGSTGEGTKKAPSLRVLEVQHAPAGAVFWILTNGVVRRGMPVWSKLPEPQRWQIVSFLQSLGVSPENPADKQSASASK